MLILMDSGKIYVVREGKMKWIKPESIEEGSAETELELNEKR